MLTEAEVIAVFGDRMRAKYSCLIEGAWVEWDPTKNQLSFVLMHDDEKFGAARDYMAFNGRDFSSIEDLEEYARVQEWPGWQKIKQDFLFGDDE